MEPGSSAKFDCYKSLIEDDEAEILAAIKDAAKNKSQKVRTSLKSCQKIPVGAKPTDSIPASQFDQLPVEVLEHVLQYLNNDDIRSLCQANEVVKLGVKNSSKFKHHLVDRHILLKQCSIRQAVFNAVRKDFQLMAYLNTNVTFVRLLPELRAGPQRTVANSLFHFGPATLAGKLQFLLTIAAKRFEYRQHHLFIVVATSEAEGTALVHGLSDAGYESAYFSNFNSTEAFARISNASRKFFFVVKRLTVNFRQTGMRAIIDFRKLGTFDDHMEFHCLNPKSLYTFVDIDDRDELRKASDLLRFLNYIGEKPLQYGRPQLLSRSFYLKRVSFSN